MEISKSIEEIGKYFNEILGYLLPGLSLIFLIYFFVDLRYVNQSLFKTEYNAWITIFIGYILGYLIYGLSLVRDKILGIKGMKSLCEKNVFGLKLFSFFENIVEATKKEIVKSDEFNLSKQEIIKLIPSLKEENCDFHMVRNIAMSYVPEIDQKIYTFMFRADLFDHIKIIFYLISLWGLVAKLNLWIFNNTLLFDLRGNNFWYLFLLLFATYPLKLGRKRFLKIAYKIQFHLFITKCHPIK